MKTRILLLIFLVTNFSLDAQTTFLKHYSNGIDTSYCFQSLLETRDSGYIAVGYKVYCESNTNTRCYGKGYVVKTDKFGNTNWEREYSYLGKNDLEFYDIIPTGPEDYVICGLIDEGIPGLSSYDYYACKIDDRGNILWQNRYGSVGVKEWGYEIREAVDTTYLLTGWSDAGNYSMELTKIDGNGNPVWNKLYGTQDAEMSYTISLTKDTGMLIAGTTTYWSSAIGYVIKLDKHGDTTWTKSYPAISQIRKIVAHDDGNFSVTGYCLAPHSAPYLALCDQSGNIIWKKDYTDPNSLSWSYSHTRTKDSGYVLAAMTTNTDYDFRIIKTDNAGNIIWDRDYDSKNDYSNDIIQTRDGGYTLCGNSSSYATLLRVDSLGNTNLLTKMAGSLSKQYLTVYPQPARDKIYISQDRSVTIFFVELMDVAGKKIRTYNEVKNGIDVTGLPKGHYLLNIKTNKGLSVEKIVVE